MARASAIIVLARCAHAACAVPLPPACRSIHCRACISGARIETIAKRQAREADEIATLIEGLALIAPVHRQGALSKEARGHARRAAGLLFAKLSAIRIEP